MHSAVTKGEVPASGAACFIYFQQREPKCKGWSEFALWKLPVWNSPAPIKQEKDLAVV